MVPDNYTCLSTAKWMFVWSANPHSKINTIFLRVLCGDLVTEQFIHNDDDDDQWRYSPDRALAFLYEFHDSL
jgi:hypothetical protein